MLVGPHFVSKPSAAEATYMRIIGERMAEGEIRCCCIPKYVATERHHPTGMFWETGKGLKAHDWFILPLSNEAHRQYHQLGVVEWTRRYGTHETLLKRFWESIGFVPGEWMLVGTEPKRSAWLKRVLGRLGVDKMSVSRETEAEKACEKFRGWPL